MVFNPLSTEFAGRGLMLKNPQAANLTPPFPIRAHPTFHLQPSQPAHFFTTTTSPLSRRERTSIGRDLSPLPDILRKAA